MSSERTLETITAELGALADRPSTALSLALVGQPGSRWRIPTPAGVIDLDAFDRNVARMAARAKAAGLALRPHAKSHKCAALARRQIAAGAVGVCCAKLAEAEALSAAGIRGILITSSLAGAPSAARAARLARIDPAFAITVDHPDGATEIGQAAQAAGVTVRVVIDVDLGMGRTGVASVEQAVAVGAALAAQPWLKLIGVQGYGGHWQHMSGANARTAAVADGIGKLSEVAAALRAHGHEITLMTGGGTGTFSADAAQGVLNEIQAGSYAFMDREYREALGSAEDGAFETPGPGDQRQRRTLGDGGRRPEGLRHGWARSGAPGGRLGGIKIPLLRRRARHGDAAEASGGEPWGQGRVHRPALRPHHRPLRPAAPGAGRRPGGRGAGRGPGRLAVGVRASPGSGPRGRRR